MGRAEWKYCNSEDAAEGSPQTLRRCRKPPSNEQSSHIWLWAARNGHENVVKLLLEAEASDYDVKDNDGMSPLSLASRGGYEDIVELFCSTKHEDMRRAE